MREIVIKTGTYGLRIGSGRVRPVSRGERAKVSDDEADRLVALGVAAYTNAPAEAGNTPPAPPTGGGKPEDGRQNTPGEDHPAEAGTGAAEGTPGVTEGDPDAAEVRRLERMTKSDLEQMAKDMDVDISKCRNKGEIANLLASVEVQDGGDAPPNLSAEGPVV